MIGGLIVTRKLEFQRDCGERANLFAHIRADGVPVETGGGKAAKM